MTTKKDFLWWRDGVIYQIYPRSYLDTTGDGIGDLPGIISKLDYIADLGVDAIWLSPIYPSPDVDFGYDVADYRGIDPKFGTMQDFEHLLTQAHARGLRIIMDLVLNHTSNQHPWFVEARKSKENPYHDYYLWQDAKPNGKTPNNWAAIFGGSAWEYDEQVGQYYMHLFYKEQVDVNWRNPTLYQEMMEIFRFWCDKGVDGFRLDVFNLYYKHADFPDNPKKIPPSPPFFRPWDQQKHIYDYDQPEMMPALQEIRSILDSYPERYAVGETFPEDAESAAKYSQPGHLHAAFNFEFTHCEWLARPFQSAIERYEALMGEGQWPCYVLGNHDISRPATRYAKGEDDDDRLKVAAAMLLTMRGTPFIYYGDEIGQRDITIHKKEDVLDPIGKTFWPFFKGRDGCRAPMQWNKAMNAGFSSGKPWLPVHENFTNRNVSAQADDPQSLLHFYRSLLKLRKEHPALHSGELRMLIEKPQFVMAYERKNHDETFLILINFSRFERELEILEIGPSEIWQPVLSTHEPAAFVYQAGKLTLQGNQALILMRNGG
ncbi:MAG: alpha-glucosidase [Anaerolineae bacterium]|jgi:alpha-glucosidase|nr:alpha-glucosidase [Anaerolineae bacterium]